MLAISDFFRDSNYFESCFWIAIGLGFGVAGIATQRRRRCMVACVTFLLFGLSDDVEAHTGAWWRPWWLLVWKGGCLLVLLVLLIQHARKRAPVPSP